MLGKIPSIVDTCRVCRMWTRPSPHATATSRLTTAFNQVMQYDLVFIDSKIVLHMICTTIRWSVTEEIPDRLTETILSAITLRWFSVFGPPEAVEGDQEGALGSAEGAVWASRWGASRKLRPKEAHAWMIERHNELLRQHWHLVNSQLKDEGLKVPFKLTLAESTFAKNVLLSVDGATPYNALYGRTPRMLIDFERAPGASADDSIGMPGISKAVHRCREISLGKMIEAQAKMRIQRAITDRTRPAAQLLDLRTGDLIDFHRKEQQKDLPGWRGPATVTDLSRQDDGIIQFDFQGRSMSARPADVRRALMHLIFLAASARGPRTSPWDVIVLALGCMVSGSWLALGWELRAGGWTMTADTPKHYSVYLAALQCAACGLHLAGAITVRLAAGASNLPGAHGADDSVICWWHRSRPDLVNSIHLDGTQRLNLRRLVESYGHPWNDTTNVHFIQFLIMEPDVVDTVQRLDPSVPHLGGAHVPGLHDVQWRTTPGVDRGARRPRDPDESSENPAPRHAPRHEPGRGVTREREQDEEDQQPPAHRARVEPPMVEAPADNMEQEGPPEDPEDLLAWLAADESQWVSEEWRGRADRHP